MSLALLKHLDQEDPQVRPGPEPAPTSGHDHGDYDQNLDAMGNGKGKGKGKGDGNCHTCGGEGHYARECPSVPPVGPQSQ